MITHRPTDAEILEAWEDRAEDVFISHQGHAFYLGTQIAEALEGAPDFKAIRQWMFRNMYFPNVWALSDHGNVELISINEDGEVTYLGGFV